MGKEIQRESLLIAGGCSFGDSTYSGYLKHNVTPWPELAGKELGIEMLWNCGGGKIQSSSDLVTKQKDRK